MTSAQRHNARQDAIWDRAMALKKIQMQTDLRHRTKPQPTQDKPKAGEPPTQAHTPGPWHVIATNGMPKVNMVNPPAGGGFIARIGYPPIGNRDANARLIAAAPETKAQRDELLAACEELIKVYLWDAKTYGFSARHGTIDEARAAIARVEAKL